PAVQGSVQSRCGCLWLMTCDRRWCAGQAGASSVGHGGMRLEARRPSELRYVGIERLCRVRGRRIEQQVDAQSRLLECALAVAIERDAAFERLQRIIEAELALFHPYHELFQLVERLLEFGDR